jgi:hypothetical protein
MYCECGCGALAPISPQTDTKRGYVKGQPRRFRKGHWARGRKHSPETIAKMKQAQLGKKHPLWKGGDVSYSGAHMWVRRNYPKTGICEECGANVGNTGQGGTHWANISGNYVREDRSDWRELCVSCHAKMDVRITNLR